MRTFWTSTAATILIVSIPFARAATISPPPPDPEATRLIQTLGLVESETALRDTPGWKKPRKILVQSADASTLEQYRSAAPGVQVLSAETSEAAAKVARDADALINFCDPTVLDVAKRVRWIHVLGAGVERCVSVPGVKERNLLLTNTQRVAGPVIAEHTIAMLLALSRGFTETIPLQAKGDWATGRTQAPRQMKVIAGKTLLVAGLGGIGTEVARRAHALGMTVIATRASDRPAPDFVSHVGTPEELPELLKQADAVVNALPLTEATRGLFDAKLFALMKPTAYFLNVGRGGSVVQSDLVAALNTGVIAGAGLDVTDPEPLPAENALWRAKNVLITPHISSQSDLGYQTTLIVARENLRRYVNGDKLLSVVDVQRGY